MTIPAIYKDGVFRPLEAVNLPENARVVFDPTVVGPPPEPRDPQARIFEILRTSFPSGKTDVAERHDEHQP